MVALVIFDEPPVLAAPFGFDVLAFDVVDELLPQAASAAASATQHIKVAPPRRILMKSPSSTR